MSEKIRKALKAADLHLYALGVPEADPTRLLLVEAYDEITPAPTATQGREAELRELAEALFRPVKAGKGERRATVPYKALEELRRALATPAPEAPGMRECIECGLPMFQRPAGILCCDNPYCTYSVPLLAGAPCPACKGTGENPNASDIAKAVALARGYDKSGKLSCKDCNGTGLSAQPDAKKGDA